MQMPNDSLREKNPSDTAVTAMQQGQLGQLRLDMQVHLHSGYISLLLKYVCSMSTARDLTLVCCHQTAVWDQHTPLATHVPIKTTGQLEG